MPLKPLARTASVRTPSIAEASHDQFAAPIQHARGHFSPNIVCRSYSPRRVRTRRGETHEQENGVGSSHTRSNGPVLAITHQVNMGAAGFTHVLGTALSS